MTAGSLDTPEPATLLELTAATAGLTAAVFAVTVFAYRDRTPGTHRATPRPRDLVVRFRESLTDAITQAALRPGPALSGLVSFGVLAGATAGFLQSLRDADPHHRL